MSTLLTSGYWGMSSKQKNKVQTVIFGLFLDEAQGDLTECQYLLYDALEKYELEEYYEHCSVLKDILNRFEHK